MSVHGPAAVVFDLDGVLIDSEQAWDAARRGLAAEHDRPWPPDATEAMIGMSAPEWSRYLHDVVELPPAPDRIESAVLARLSAVYRAQLPVVDGAPETVRAAAERWTLGLASSSNREIIELVLSLMELRECFAVVVASEEVSRGKPAPDVYLEATRQLSAPPARCVAIEDSANGLRSASAAAMTTIAVPNRVFPPAPDALALAAVVVGDIREVTPALIERVGGA